MTDDNEPATREWWLTVVAECRSSDREVIRTTGARPTTIGMEYSSFYMSRFDEDNRLDIAELGPLTKHRVRELLRGLGVKCKS